MNLTIFLRAWKLDFWPLLGVYPPGLALADYWSHLLGVYPLWPGVYPPSLALGLPLGWAKPGVYPPWPHGVYPPNGLPPRFEAKG